MKESAKENSLIRESSNPNQKRKFFPRIYNDRVLPLYFFIKKHKKIIVPFFIVGTTFLMTKRSARAQDLESTAEIFNLVKNPKILAKVLKNYYVKKNIQENDIAYFIAKYSRHRDVYKQIVPGKYVEKFIAGTHQIDAAKVPSIILRGHHFIPEGRLKFGLGLTALALCYGYSCMKVLDYLDYLDYIKHK